MRHSINMAVGRNIKTLRTYKDITQAKLAQILGISIATMSLYEKGERSVPLEYLLTLSRVFNVKLDDLCSLTTFEERKESEVFFEHFKTGSSTIYTAGETKVSNPYSMYFTLEDLNGDTLVFLRSSEITEGIMLVSENPIVGKVDKLDVSHLKNKRLFMTTISVFDQLNGKASLYAYTDIHGQKMIMKNKTMFIYYGYLIARINHIAKTEEFFFPLKY